MMPALNIPYVKKFDDKGLVLNPIKANYLSLNPNRKQRREDLNIRPFTGNGKNLSMTIEGVNKYYRVLQVVKGADSKYVNIEHYLIRNW